ncbi:MAG: isocitrate/isopropylmalate family dehydrogenase [Eubacteriaceae bacterium]|nr:isocitrate/isopropylmalate family dehydrogenase [Eubacteriaceae bacterium]
MENDYSNIAKQAAIKFEKLLISQLERAEKIKTSQQPIDYLSLPTIRIGICGGDGIGPIISAEAESVLRYLLSSQIASGKVELVTIEGLTIENRIACGQSIPDGVLDEIKSCHVILKGPTTTPQAGDGILNLESANVRMRKELDLYANVRPVKSESQGIDWTFFRENTEGAYTLGSEGIDVTEDLAIDFAVTTNPGTERIARLAYSFAEREGKERVSIVTKANVVKATDGKFLNICRQVASEYPHIQTDEWYIDILAAKLIDEKRRTSFKVLVLPNLYGDIITDEAAEFQGGVGTAGSANIGDRYAMFEAIHGSAPRMVAEGRQQYADPSSILRAAAMLCSHIGFLEESGKLNSALDYCMNELPEAIVTGRPGGATCSEFGAYLKQALAQGR